MQRQRVRSSGLESVGYNKTEAMLEVAFKHGGVYRYFGVPVEMHRALLNAASLGKFFNDNIRDAFRSREVL